MTRGSWRPPSWTASSIPSSTTLWNPEKGEPSSLDIYYCDAAGESITIPGLDVTIPMDTPYSGLAMA